MRDADRGSDAAEPRADPAEPLRGDGAADDDEAHPGEGTPLAQGSLQEGRPRRPLRHRLPGVTVRTSSYKRTTQVINEKLLCFITAGPGLMLQLEL